MQTSEPTLQAPEFFNFATDVIDQWAKKRPDAPALWWVDAGTRAEHKYTFREISALSCQAANFLRAAGVKRGDRVLVIDDFLARGEALRGLCEIVQAAGAELVGIGCAVEKGFQGGGDKLRAAGVNLHSLAIIESAEPGNIVFREEA